MPRYLPTLALSLQLCMAAAQCPIGNVLITSPADLENFAMLYGSCDTLPGDLVIANTEVASYSAFSNLRMVRGDLRLQAIPPGAPDLAGFDQLAHIGGDLWLNSLPQISLNGLGALQRVDGDLSIEFAGITNFNGLSSLSVIGGDLKVMHAPYMTSFSGLVQLDSILGNATMNEAIDNAAFTTIMIPADLKFVGGDLYLLTDHATTLSGGNSLDRIGGTLHVSGPMLQSVSGMNNLNVVGNLDFNLLPAFTTINGFNGLDTIQGAFNLTNAPLLTSLSGFPALQEIGDLLWVTGGALQSITGFPQLSAIGTLTIGGCPVLTNISAFDHAITLGQIVIEDNPALSICHVESVCYKLANASPGGQNIANNASGCTSLEEVLTFCELTTGLDMSDHGAGTVMLFPNPVREVLHVVSARPIDRMLVRDIRGTTMPQATSSPGTIDVRGLPAGSYVLEVLCAADRHTLMFLKE